ncbi:cytochrome b [Burkholderia pseudomultivorans]|uniref:cytochrome b n=1 Tax=Burkholderia pseudomultivorans TaxID=1207504 RepID=UPI00075B93A3|nr:cytochrome b [Burkholderia pseudomultivorans]KVC27034.1 cytochrome B [Burkholderia pseudomultivorans]KVC28077.1 cytochrome B [Burkholderia pseudomultivorans]KVC41061.1 cytochrome B [Burkholderia pseudomultivorans]MDS0790652.1 cytochrome b [Burkholderia pseudomultivorans]
MNTRKSTNGGAPRHFNALARGLHWLMAAMILAMLFIGVGMVTSLHHRIWLIDLHRPLGIAILVLALLRLANRLCSRPPALPASLPHWQVLAAKASHWALYALMLALPVVGWALLSAGGFPIVMFKGVNLPAIVPASPALYAWLRDAHGVLARLLFAVALAHLSAALVHAWIYRDGVFSSMVRKVRPRG